MTPQFDSLLDFLLVHQRALKYLIKIFEIKKINLALICRRLFSNVWNASILDIFFSYRFLVNFYCKICLKIYNIKVDRHTWSFVKTFLKNTIFKALECFIRQCLFLTWCLWSNHSFRNLMGKCVLIMPRTVSFLKIASPFLDKRNSEVLFFK